MKLTFQTFCLLFLVAAVHLALIIALTPVTKSASDYFADLDVERMFEGDRGEDSSESEPDMREDFETAPTPGDPEKEDETTIAQSEPAPGGSDRSPTSRDPGSESEGSGDGIASTEAERNEREAVVDSRMLGKRVEHPEFIGGRPWDNESKSEDTAGRPDRPAEKAEAASGKPESRAEPPLAQPVKPVTGDRKVREFRPLSGS